MDSELEGIWNGFRLTEEEKETVETEDDQNIGNGEDGKTWMVGKLITQRPFNKEAMLGTLKVVWRISKEAVVTVLDSNLFLFKFNTMNDKLRVMDGSPWSFNNNLIAFKDYNGDLRGTEYCFDKAQFWVRIYGLPLKMLTNQYANSISMKIGELLKTDVGSGDFLRVRVNIDLTKPLRRFVTISGMGGQGDIMARLAYERLPTFCYECGLIGHSDIECQMTSADQSGENTIRQYGEWLRASPIQRRNQHWSNGGMGSFEKKVEANKRATKGKSLQIEAPVAHGGALHKLQNVTVPVINRAVTAPEWKIGDVGSSRAQEVSGEKLNDMHGGSYAWTGKKDNVYSSVAGGYQSGEVSNVNLVIQGKEKGRHAGGADLYQKTVDIYSHNGKKTEVKNVSKGTKISTDVLTGLNKNADEDSYSPFVEHQLQNEGGTPELQVIELKGEDEQKDKAYSKPIEDDMTTLSALKNSGICKTSAGSTWKRRARTAEGAKGIDLSSTKRKIESLSQMDPEGENIENSKKIKKTSVEKQQNIAARTELQSRRSQ